MAFDEAAADNAVFLIESSLTHVEGDLAGKPFLLAPWQRETVRELFGRKREDGKRQYRTLWLEVPRKNGKSTFGAALMLATFFLDREPGAQIYSVASNYEQANIVFGLAKAMVEACPSLLDRVQLYKDRIVSHRYRGFYRVIHADVDRQRGKHGLNPHAVGFDEVHEQPNRYLWDAFKTAMVSRSQPLMVGMTTAGHDRNSICWEIHDYACKVRDGIVVDPTFLPVIFAANEDEDWTSEAVWAKANPNYGVSVRPEALREAVEKAKANPALENAFRRLHLNQWTEQATRWLPMHVYDRCNTPVDPDALRGRECWAGLDLGWANDLAALVLIFPDNSGDEPVYDVLAWFWCPEDTAGVRAKRDRVAYDRWIDAGYITATDGSVTDFGAIHDKAEELSQDYVINALAFDPRNATQTSNELDARGIEVFVFAQTFANFNEPMQRFMEALQAGRVRHGGNPVLRWMFSNLVVRLHETYIRPDKSKSGEKIDGAVATFMAFGLAITNEQQGIGEILFL